MRKPENTAYSPDMIDVYNIVADIGTTFGLRVQFTAEYIPDYFQVIARAFKPNGAGNDVVQFQALVKKPIQFKGDPAHIFFTLAWDIFQQADSGVMGFKAEKPALGWSGRPQLRGRTRKG